MKKTLALTVAILLVIIASPVLGDQKKDVMQEVSFDEVRWNFQYDWHVIITELDDIQVDLLFAGHPKEKKINNGVLVNSADQIVGEVIIRRYPGKDWKVILTSTYFIPPASKAGWEKNFPVTVQPYSNFDMEENPEFTKCKMITLTGITIPK